MSLKSTVSVIVTITFALSTSGTLAHAKNAYQRAQGTARLNEQARAQARIERARTETLKVLEKWKGRDAEIQKLVDANLDQHILKFVDQQTNPLKSLNPDESKRLEVDFKKVIRAAAKAGDVAAAEKLEAVTRYTSEGTAASIQRYIADHAFRSLKAQLLQRFEQAGGLYGFLQEELQKRRSGWGISEDTQRAFGIFFGIIGMVIGLGLIGAAGYAGVFLLAEAVTLGSISAGITGTIFLGAAICFVVFFILDATGNL